MTLPIIESNALQRRVSWGDDAKPNVAMLDALLYAYCTGVSDYGMTEPDQAGEVGDVFYANFNTNKYEGVNFCGLVIYIHVDDYDSPQGGQFFQVIARFDGQSIASWEAMLDDSRRGVLLVMPFYVPRALNTVASAVLTQGSTSTVPDWGMQLYWLDDVYVTVYAEPLLPSSSFFTRVLDELEPLFALPSERFFNGGES